MAQRMGLTAYSHGPCGLQHHALWPTAMGTVAFDLCECIQRALQALSFVLQHHAAVVPTCTPHTCATCERGAEQGSIRASERACVVHACVHVCVRASMDCGTIVSVVFALNIVPCQHIAHLVCPAESRRRSLHRLLVCTCVHVCAYACVHACVRMYGSAIFARLCDAHALVREFMRTFSCAHVHVYVCMHVRMGTYTDA